MITAKTQCHYLFALLLAATLLAPATVCAQEFSFDGAPASGEVQTVAVVALAGYQNAMDDVDYVGGLLGMPQASQMINGMATMMAGPNGLEALDKSQPWGVIVRSGGMDISPIVCLPVTDLDALLAIGAGAGVVVDDLGEGIKSAAMQGQTVFLKGQGGWVFAAQNAAMLSDLPENPATQFADLVSEFDLGVTLMAQKVPPMFKQMLIGGLMQGMQQSLEQQPGEPDEQFALRKQMAEANAQNLQNFVEGLDEATIGLAVNPDGGGLLVDVSLKAIAGAPLATSMSMYQASPGTRFAGFLKEDASLSAATAYSVPADALPQMVASYERQTASVKKLLLDAIREDEALPNDEVRQTLEAILNDVFGCMDATVRTGQGDFVGHAQLRPGGLSIAGAIATPEPEKLDAALKKAVALTENDPKFPPVTWAGDTHQGVEIHSMVISIDDFEAQQVLGDFIRIAVGIGTDAAYLSVGPDAVEDLKAALDASAAAGVTPIKPIQMTIGLAQLMEFSTVAAEATGEDSATTKMLAQLLSGEEKNRIHVTLDSQPGGLRYKLVLEEGVLKAIGVMGAEMQAAMGQSAPPF